MKPESSYSGFYKVHNKNTQTRQQKFVFTGLEFQAVDCQVREESTLTEQTPCFNYTISCYATKKIYTLGDKIKEPSWQIDRSGRNAGDFLILLRSSKGEIVNQQTNQMTIYMCIPC